MTGENIREQREVTEKKDDQWENDNDVPYLSSSLQDRCDPLTTIGQFLQLYFHHRQPLFDIDLLMKMPN